MSGAIPTEFPAFEDKDGGAIRHIVQPESHFFDQFLSYDDSESFESSENSHGSNFFDFDFTVAMEPSSGDSMADASSARSSASQQRQPLQSAWRPDPWRSQLENATRTQRRAAGPDTTTARSEAPAIDVDSLFDFGTTPTPTPPAVHRSSRPLTPPPQHTKAHYAVRTPMTTPTHRGTRPSANGPSPSMMRPPYSKPESDWTERFQHFTLQQQPQHHQHQHPGPLTPPNSGRVQQGAHVAPARLVTSPFQPEPHSQPETISPSLISPLSNNSAYSSFTSPVSPFYSDPFAADFSAAGLFISLPPSNALPTISTVPSAAAFPGNIPSAYPSPPLPAVKDAYLFSPDIPLPSIETDDLTTPFTPTAPSRYSRRARRARSTPSIFFSSSSPSPPPTAPPTAPRKSASASGRSKSRASSTKSQQQQHRRNKSTPYGRGGVSKAGGGGGHGQGGGGGGGGFINFTPSDSRRILSGVAPSGSSKTKARREKEAFEKRRKDSEMAAKAIGLEVDAFLALMETGRS